MSEVKRFIKNAIEPIDYAASKLPTFAANKQEKGTTEIKMSGSNANSSPDSVSIFIYSESSQRKNDQNIVITQQCISRLCAFVVPPLDFDVLREIWNKYELTDHSAVVKVKVVLTTVSKSPALQASIGSATAGTNLPSAQAQYNFGLQNIVVALSNERGQPDNHNYSPQELQASITRDDLRFTTITQDWNEYVVDDGTRIKIQPLIMRIAKTSRFTNKGEPIYYTDINVTVQVRPPSSSPPALST